MSALAALCRIVEGRGYCPMPTKFVMVHRNKRRSRGRGRPEPEIRGAFGDTDHGTGLPCTVRGSGEAAPALWYMAGGESGTRA